MEKTWDRRVEPWKVGEEECTNQNVTFYNLVPILRLVFCSRVPFVHSLFFLFSFLFVIVFFPMDPHQPMGVGRLYEKICNN